LNILMILCQLVCVNCLSWIKEFQSFTDKRELDKDGNFVSEIFHSERSLKNTFVLDGNREPIIACNFYG
jgi:hypothetical protein